MHSDFPLDLSMLLHSLGVPTFLDLVQWATEEQPDSSKTGSRGANFSGAGMEFKGSGPAARSGPALLVRGVHSLVLRAVGAVAVRGGSWACTCAAGMPLHARHQRQLHAALHSCC